MVVLASQIFPSQGKGHNSCRHHLIDNVPKVKVTKRLEAVLMGKRKLDRTPDGKGRETLANTQVNGDLNLHLQSFTQINPLHSRTNISSEMPLPTGLNTLKIQMSEVSGSSEGLDRGREVQKGRGTCPRS